ncbi:MAG: hypothetical protein ABSD73_09790 [Candidatus Bathyarchaeia archaeon]|jgi:hypothetical protein
MFLILDSILSQTDLVSLVVLIIGLIILWIIVSIPAYLAGKVVTSGRSTFGEAMLATLFGPIVYAVTLIVVDYFLGAIIGGAASVIALILAFIAWVWVFKASFKTGWLGGLGIAILSVIVFWILSIILGFLFGSITTTHYFPSF